MKRAKLQHLRQQRQDPQGLALERPAGTTAAVDAASSAPKRQRLLSAAAERVPLLIRAMGRDEHCRWANSSWSAFTGRSLEQTLGDGWLGAVHADDRALCAQDDVDGSEGQDFRELEYRLRRADGDFAWIHEYRAPRLRSRGGGVGYLATAVAVSLRKRAELHVQHVHLLLEHRRGSLHAVVTDDGIGMEPDAALHGGYGLLSIRERMGHIGGRMAIDSSRGKGTTVRLSTPLRAGKSKDRRTEIR